MSIAADTNLLVVANARDICTSSECQLSVINLLLEVRESKDLLLDVKGDVLAEYALYCNFRGAPGVGDEFFRWAFQNQGFLKRIALTPHPDRAYEEFPATADLADFDPADRKFVALAAASPGGVVANAVDSDYSEAAEALAAAGVDVIELCPHELRASH